MNCIWIYWICVLGYAAELFNNCLITFPSFLIRILMTSLQTQSDERGRVHRLEIYPWSFAWLNSVYNLTTCYSIRILRLLLVYNTTILFKLPFRVWSYVYIWQFRLLHFAVPPYPKQVLPSKLPCRLSTSIPMQTWDRTAFTARKIKFPLALLYSSCSPRPSLIPFHLEERRSLLPFA